MLSVLVLFIALECSRQHYVANAFWQAGIAIAALLLPIVKFAPKGNALPYIGGTVILIATMFLLPGYSSAWAPLVWALILFRVNSEKRRPLPVATAAASAFATETRADEQS